MPGVAILAVLVGVSTAVFFVDTIRRALEEGPDVVVLASAARGLTPGADVWVAGSPAGRVTRVLFGDPHGPAERRVVIHAILHRSAVPFLRADAQARIASSSLLAPVVLKLDPGHRDRGPFDFADTLTVPAHRSTDRLLSLVADARPAVDTLKLLSERLATRLAQGPGTATSLRRDTALLARLKEIAGDARAVSAVLASEEALPARLASDSLGAALGAMLSTLAGLRGEDRAAEAADTVVELARRLERISSDLDRLDRELRAGRGTAGRALYDDELARQQAAFRARMDSLKTEMRRQPWRWLRFKLF